MAPSIDPSAILGQVTEGYMKLPLLQKILLPLIIVGTFIGILMVSQWASRPEYSVLFSDLDPADSAAVIERLKTDRIAYQVRSEGRTIAISPPSMVHELRIQLASEGVPRSGTVGFEIFDSAELGTTTFQEKMKFLRASQGELERTIVALEAVQSARVHITQPERTVFARRGADATASVLLRLRPGAELDRRQIQGIGRLVAGSVENLTPENVSIIDDRGNLLTPADNESEDSFTQEATRLQYQRALEKGYAQRIEQMLARVVGADRIIARVSAELDFSKNEREEESFDPGGRVIRSERSVEEGAGGEVRGGIPGVVSNLEDAPRLLEAQNGSSNTRKEAVRNYEVSRAVTRISAPRGQLTRLSVAVLVDSTHLNTIEGSTGLMGSALSSQIESIVRSAVGFDVTRGDTVTVEAVPFQQSEFDFAEAFANQDMKDTILTALQYLAPTVLVILFFFLFVRPFVKFLTTPSDAEVNLDRLLPTGMKELEAELNAERKRAALVPEYEAAVDIEQLEELMAENSRVVKENPGQAALLIRYWLNDGRL